MFQLWNSDCDLYADRKTMTLTQQAMITTQIVITIQIVTTARIVA